MAQVPVDVLLGTHVIDWTRVLVADPEFQMSYDARDALGEPGADGGWARVEGDQRVLVRIDGVVYLLGGHPLRADRRVEGPAFRGPGDEPDETSRLEDERDHDVPLWAVADPDDPIVATLVHREPQPLRRGDHVFASNTMVGSHLLGATGEREIPTDRMDETSGRLCAIDERTGLIVLEIGARWYWRAVQDTRSERLILPLSSGVNVRPGQSAMVASRPQGTAFRPQKLIIGGTPRDWVVQDVRIGNRSQFAQSGHIPGDLFSAQAIDSFVAFEVASPATDIAITVAYVGDDPAGAPFVGAMIGESAAPAGQRRMTRVAARCSAVRWTPEGRLQGWMIGLSGEDENRDFDPSAPTPVAGATESSGLVVVAPSSDRVTGPVAEVVEPRILDDEVVAVPLALEVSAIPQEIRGATADQDAPMPRIPCPPRRW